MILFLCYVCPPLAVLCMGRPFSSVLNMFLTCFFWVPGIGHALVCYADYKSDTMVRAIHRPKWTRGMEQEAEGRSRRPSKSQREAVVVYDNPHVGKGGTYFRPKN
jgi:uncharacterized membrane protein YqaE (UPF0057 family)